MNDQITYLNTDLDLISSNDLMALAAALEARGVFPLHVTQGEKGLWSASFETAEDYDEPELGIAAMLAAIELLDPPLRLDWDRCSLREFNIGYDCGQDPWAFNQGLTATLLGRMAAAGASLRFTLYPDREQASASNEEK